MATYAPNDFQYSELNNQQYFKDDAVNTAAKSKKGKYMEGQTAYIREMLMEAGSMAAIQLLQNRKKKAVDRVEPMELIRYGTLSGVYNRYIENENSKFFGFEWPKLKLIFEAGEDSRITGEMLLHLQKLGYFFLIHWGLARVGVLQKFDRDTAMRYFYAVALRAGVGFATEDSPA